ncbi:MAG: YvcK family protein [Candidatus Pacebacteria bacterium]|nr:YvcK family protein [Candidatus Paceibacterota bacterium]
MPTPKTKVVVVGGGTGTYTLLRGLRPYHEELDIAAIVTMADSGGSTGRLRDEFGQLPVGDVRQALAALATDVSGANNLLRDLFLYRFKSGEGLSGHNFGNLFLTALIDILGSESEAIAAASELLRIRGRVIPVTTDHVDLQARYLSGRVIVGEHAIDESDGDNIYDRIVELTLTPNAQIAREAKEAIIAAEYIIFGPGDFYTSILANVVVDGFSASVAQSNATTIFVANLMARPGQTIGMQLSDYVAEFVHYLNKPPDIVLVPDAPLSVVLTTHYKTVDGVHPVSYELQSNEVSLCRAAIVNNEIITAQPGDALSRSLIRHDSNALGQAIIELLHSQAN